MLPQKTNAKRAEQSKEQSREVSFIKKGLALFMTPYKSCS